MMARSNSSTLKFYCLVVLSLTLVHLPAEALTTFSRLIDFILQ